MASKSGNLALTRTLTKKKYTFSCITWVPVPQIKHMGACLREKNLEVHYHGFLCLKLNIWGLVWKVFARGKFRGTLPWSAVHVAYSLIRPKSQIPNIRHDGTLSIGNFMLMTKKPKDLEFEPLHPKNVLLASVAHGISCFFIYTLGHTNMQPWIFWGKVEKKEEISET
jgi:hypothetical protein